MNIEHLLNEEIEQRLQDLSKMDPGTKEYSMGVDSLTKLVDRSIEINRFNNECEDKAHDREFDERFKITQSIEDRRDRLTKNIITGAGVVIPSAITIWGTLKMLKFEETGTVTTTIGRGFINRLLPKK